MGGRPSRPDFRYRESGTSDEPQKVDILARRPEPAPTDLAQISEQLALLTERMASLSESRAGGGETLFRTVNDADGWEKAGLFPGEDVDAVEAHPHRAGYVAVAARLASDGTSVTARV